MAGIAMGQVARLARGLPGTADSCGQHYGREVDQDRYADRRRVRKRQHYRGDYGDG
jgi:hypothetical protein